MTSIVIMLTIESDANRRGQPRATVKATTEHPDYDVAVIGAGFVHGRHGTVAADLAVKVAPKETAVFMSQHPSGHSAASHSAPRRHPKTTATTPNDDT